MHELELQRMDVLDWKLQETSAHMAERGKLTANSTRDTAVTPSGIQEELLSMAVVAE